MDEQFRFSRWAGAAIAVLAAVGIGVMAYQAGVSHGVALQLPAGSTPVVPPYYWGWYRPWGFGFAGPIFFFILAWLVLSRVLFWHGGRRWRRRSWDDGPDLFDEWHRRAHERMHDKSSSPSNA